MRERRPVREQCEINKSEVCEERPVKSWHSQKYSNIQEDPPISAFMVVQNKMKTITSTTNQSVSGVLSLLKMKECSVSSAVHIIQ